MKVKGLSRLSAAIDAVHRETKKAGADLVNKALKDVCLLAMKYTPFAQPGLIQAQLYRDKIALKIAARRVARRAGKQKVDRFGNTKLSGKGRAQTYSGTAKEIAKEADRILKRAIASSRALRAGWIPGARRVGAQIRGGGRLMPSGTAARGTGEKATISSLKGFIRNALVTRARATGKRMPVASIGNAVMGLNRAIAEVASDREAYARKKAYGKILRKYSSK